MRLFVAIELNDAVRALAAKAVSALREAGVPGRFEFPEKLHVTMAFLGRVPDDRLQAVVETFRTSGQHEPFWIDFDRLGAFPSARRPHTIWIGSTQESSGFVSCAQSVRDGFERLGFRFEHEATPHITICRVKHVAALMLPELVDNVRLPVQGLTLFQSLPAGPTTRYEAIDRTHFTSPL